MNDPAQIFFIWLTIIFLWWFFHWPHQSFWKDLTRQRLFETRDKIFLQVANTDGAEFNQPAYRFLRMRFNAVIRNIDTLSLTNFLFLSYGLNQSREVKKHINNERKKIMETMSELSFEQKKLLLESEDKLHLIMLEHMLRTSILLAPLFWFFLNFMYCFKKFHALKRKLIQTKKIKRLWARADYMFYNDAHDLDSLFE